ncbi:MAG TPA: hypothetical protein VMS32_05540, partial [Verrucomicrobiae bacterium]|nr:hypothetical protein [Verrucomicrobiae bacterium]
ERRLDDSVVATWVAQRTTPEQRDASDQKLKARCIADRINDDDFLQRYPEAKKRPPEMLLIDMLDADDKAMFSK